MSETKPPTSDSLRRIDPGQTPSHADAIAENLRRIAAALPPLPLQLAAAPTIEAESEPLEST